MQAFHNDPAIKAKYLERVAAHRHLDQLVQGTGWESDRGCAVGCTLDAYDHARYPIELGIPIQLAYLEDQLFELQPFVDAQAWPSRFLTAIPVGADLTGVWPQWAVWMLEDSAHGVIRYAGDRQDVIAAIRGVADLYRTGTMPSVGAAEAAKAAWTTAACDKLITLLASAKAPNS